MNTRIFSLNNCVFLYFLTPRCRRAKGNNFLLGLSFGKRVVRPKQHRGNPLCILRVFVFFLKIWGHTTNILHVFLCFCVFLSINFYFGHKSERGQTPNVFCVFLCFYQRLVWSYLRPGQPLNMFYVFLCFSTKVSGHTTHVFRVFLCFFKTTFGMILVQNGAPTQCVLCVFVFFTTGLRANNQCVFCVFLCFFCFKRTDEQGNPLCILRVFVFFLKTRGHTTNILHVFLCFLFINFFFGHKSDRGKHLMCFVCFCVFSYRSQVTRPMYFACFCVFSWDLRTHNQHPPCVFFCFCVFLFINFYFGHKSERGKTPNVFFVFLCFFLQVSGKTTNVFCVFLCFFLSTFS